MEFRTSSTQFKASLGFLELKKKGKEKKRREEGRKRKRQGRRERGWNDIKVSAMSRKVRV